MPEKWSAEQFEVERVRAVDKALALHLAAGLVEPSLIQKTLLSEDWRLHMQLQLAAINLQSSEFIIYSRVLHTACPLTHIDHRQGAS